MGAGQSQQKPKPKYVLVPPRFDRPRRDHFLMESPYSYMFAREELRQLFRWNLTTCQTGTLFFRPDQDPRFLASVRLGADADMENRNGELSFKIQPLWPVTTSFAEVRASTDGSRPHFLRGAHLQHLPHYGAVGVSASQPLGPASSQLPIQLGLRFTSPHVTTGIIATGRRGRPERAKGWLVGRYGSLIAGVQMQHDVDKDGRIRDLENWPLRTNATLAYRPEGKGNFTAAVELAEARKLQLSFYQLMAVQRNVYNVFEDDDVVGITNYIGLGLQLDTPLSNQEVPHEARPLVRRADIIPRDSRGFGDDDETALRMAFSWQINKNWMVKARFGTDALIGSMSFKGWFDPAFMLSVCAGWNQRSRRPEIGITLLIENDGAISYEKGQATTRGRAILQRHEATERDVAASMGVGPVVMKTAETEDYNAPVSQAEARTNSYL